MSRRDAEVTAQDLTGDAESRILRLPEHERDLIRLALATVGKWRVAATMGKPLLLGFDYGEIDVTARWLGITPDPRMQDGIAIIERAALQILGDT
ncbi:MAG: hypothetical protein ACPGSW_00440 [Phaeobacter italicus]